MPETIRFDDVEIDTASLIVRVDGEAVHVEPQVFDVLSYLATHRDRVVTKNELLDAIWGDRFVSESTLTSRIKTVRQVVGDDGRAQRVIRTVHGRGYQFVAEIDTTAAGPAATNGATPIEPRPTAHGRSDDFVGRDRELAALLDAITTHRLVTVVGPGGVGKTRLATEAARVWEAADRVVHVVELDAIDAPTNVLAQICAVLGVRAQGDVDLLALAAQELRGGEPLLILDNFEHVDAAAAAVDELRDRAPDAHICVTSRERLRLSREQIVRLEPLDASAELGPAAPAVALFEARARRLDPSFTVDDTNAALVSDVCRLADGLPLGLDLAAAQLGHMPLEYLRTHLERNAATIEHDLRDRPRRQRSVDELVGWSYDQLTPAAQSLLTSLSVFRGGIPLSGVLAVGGFESEPAALQAIGHLVDKSLVQLEPAGVEPRYAMLNLIRAFAANRLAATGDLAGTRDAHARWVADVVAEIEADRWDRNVGGWLDDLSREYPNIVAALDHLSASGDFATLARIVGDTNLWWYRIGRHDEARRWVELALGGGDALDDRSLGRLHYLAGLLDFVARDVAAAMDHYHRAVEHAAVADDWRYVQLARANLAVRALTDADALADATAELEAVIDAAGERGEQAVLAYALNVLGVLLHRTGRADEAQALHERATIVNRRIGDRHNEALNHANMGHIEVEAGRPDSALAASRTALGLAARIGSSVLAAWMLAEIASAERMRGNAEEATVLLGASDAYVDAIGAHRGPAAHQSWHELTTSRLRADLGDGEFERLHAAGSRLPLREATERALTT